MAPALTPRMPPKPPAARSSISWTLTRTPVRSPISRATPARNSGGLFIEGSLTRSRALATAAAMTPAFSAAARASASAPTRRSEVVLTGLGWVRCFWKEYWPRRNPSATAASPPATRPPRVVATDPARVRARPALPAAFLTVSASGSEPMPTRTTVPWGTRPAPGTQSNSPSLPVKSAPSR